MTYKLPGTLIGLMLLVISLSCGKINPTPPQVSQALEGVLSVAIAVPLGLVKAKDPNSPAIPIIMQNLQFAYTDINMLVNDQTITIEAVTDILVTLFNQLNTQFSLVDPAYAVIFSDFIKGVSIALNNLWAGTTNPAQIIEYGSEIRDAINTGAGGGLTKMMARQGRVLEQVPGIFKHCSDAKRICW